MDYLIKFDFTCFKNGRFSGKSGNVSITTEAPVPLEEIKNSDDIKWMIAKDMASQTGKDILSVDITEVCQT